MPGDVGAVAELLSKVFGWAVDPEGFAALSLDNKLKTISRGVNNAVEQGDWASFDALMAQYRELRRQT